MRAAPCGTRLQIEVVPFREGKPVTKGTAMTDPTPTPQQAAQPGAPLSESDDKLWASLAHFGGVLYILPSLIIYLVLKDRAVRTRVEAKEALNWQITFLIGWVALSILSTVIVAVLSMAGASALGLFFGALPGVWWVINVIFSIMGGVKVVQGASYRYPFTFRFIK